MATGDTSGLLTEVQLSSAGQASLRSSVVGVLVLIFALAFFSLYLRYVFGSGVNPIVLKAWQDTAGYVQDAVAKADGRDTDPVIRPGDSNPPPGTPAATGQGVTAASPAPPIAEPACQGTCQGATVDGKASEAI